MSIGQEQAITKQNMKFLIEESNRHHRREGLYKVAQIVVTPLIITLVSTMITWSINNQQAKNTEKITKQQLRSAQLIAEANRQNSTRISESDQRIERLKQIKQVFSEIVTVGDKDTELNEKNIETMRMHVISLEVYKAEALIFLLNIKEHYRNKLINEVGGTGLNEREKLYRKLIRQADESVSRILQNSQIDLSNRAFLESIQVSDEEQDLYQTKSDDASIAADYRAYFRKAARSKAKKFPALLEGVYVGGDSSFDLVTEYKALHLNKINMRNQQYNNYNFSKSDFFSVNLYRADFSYCTLIKTLFVDVDFQEAIFSESNLAGSIFWDSNLKKADFKDAKLRNVIFINPVLDKRDLDSTVKEFCDQNTCCELEGAYFSLGSLLHTDHPPFNVFDKSKKDQIPDILRKDLHALYINLLSSHRKALELMVAAAAEKGGKTAAKMSRLFLNTNTDDWEELSQRIKEAEAKANYLAMPDSVTKLSLLRRVRQ